jgi:hypothetical protein
MVPAPARIAAAPRTNSRPSCRPAVPPPPVTGASVGNEELGDGVGLGLGLGLGLGDGLVEADVDELAEVLAEVLAVALVLALVEDVDVDETVALTEPPDGVNTDDGVEPDEQAETPAAPRRIKPPQPTAVSLPLRAGSAIAARTFIEPPSCGAFPSSRPQKPAREGKRGRPVAAQATTMLRPAGGTNGEWRAQQRNIRLGG